MLRMVWQAGECGEYKKAAGCLAVVAAVGVPKLVAAIPNNRDDFNKNLCEGSSLQQRDEKKRKDKQRHNVHSSGHTACNECGSATI